MMINDFGLEGINEKLIKEFLMKVASQEYGDDMKRIIGDVKGILFLNGGDNIGLLPNYLKRDAEEKFRYRTRFGRDMLYKENELDELKASGSQEVIRYIMDCLHNVKKNEAVSR